MAEGGHCQHHPGGWCNRRAFGASATTANKIPCLFAGAASSSTKNRSTSRRPTPSAFWRPVRLAGTCARGGANLQLSSGRGTEQGRGSHRQLRRGGRDRPVWAEVRPPACNQRSPDIFFLGPAKLHR